MILHRSLLRRPLYLAVCYCAGVTGFVPFRPARVGVCSTRHDDQLRTLPTPWAPWRGTRGGGRLKNAKENGGSHDNKVKVDASTLLDSVLRRAEYTMQVRDEILAATQGDDLPSDFSRQPASAEVRELLQGIGKEITHSDATSTSEASGGTRSISSSSDGNDDDDDNDLLNYGANPTIIMTALAHTLWKSIIRPGKDSAIDATAGNGGDATALAELLFTSQASSRAASHLVCIDIQKDACEATQKKLSKILDQDTLFNHVNVHHESHAPLTLPPDGSGPVAVVCYNLGYLPGHERSEQSTITQTSTTLSSLTDAVRCLRLGGLLSVLTYPQTNSVEDAAVQAFVEGIALFSSQSHDWRDFLVQEAEDTNRRYPALNPEICSEIRQRLQYIHEELGGRQCWRVHVHEKLGWVQAPRLLTATRVR